MLDKRGDYEEVIVSDIQHLYNGTRAAKAVYGTILIFATLIAFQHTEETNAYGLALSTILAALAIVLAEIYSEILGETIRQRSKLTRAERKEIWRDSFAIISVSIWPALFFLGSKIGLWTVPVAFFIGYGYCLLILFVFSYWSSRLSGLNKPNSILRSCVLVAIGLGVVIAKYSLAH